jgi:hypothetical protein
VPREASKSGPTIMKTASLVFLAIVVSAAALAAPDGYAIRKLPSRRRSASAEHGRRRRDRGGRTVGMLP